MCKKYIKGQRVLKLHIAWSNCRQSESNELPNQHNHNSSNVKYACDQCDYESNHPGDLTEPTRLMHKLLSCADCEYSYEELTSLSLNIHIFNKNNTANKTITDKIHSNFNE